MPKATLSFSLPEETQEFEEATNAGKVKGALQEYDNKLRSLVKYGGETPEENVEWAEKARDLLYKIMNENDVNIWD